MARSSAQGCASRSPECTRAIPACVQLTGMSVPMSPSNAENIPSLCAAYRQACTTVAAKCEGHPSLRAVYGPSFCLSNVSSGTVLFLTLMQTPEQYLLPKATSYWPIGHIVPELPP